MTRLPLSRIAHGSALVLLLVVHCTIADYYDCSEPLLESAVVSATSSLRDRSPQHARLYVMGSKINGVRWWFDVRQWTPSLDEVLTAVSGIHSEEKTRVGRFVFSKDAKSSLIGRLFERKFVAEATSTAWRDVRLCRDVNGKPVVAELGDGDDDDRVQFNVSHQSGLVVFVGQVFETRGCRLGVDIMKTTYERNSSRTGSEFLKTMSRQLAKSEWDKVNAAASDTDRLATFYRFWALKESYVKALGVGITIELSDIEFHLTTDELTVGELVIDTKLFTRRQSGRRSDEPPVAETEWTFVETKITEEHCVAVAIFHPSSHSDSANLTDVSFSRVDFSELIAGSQTVTPPDLKFCEEFLQKS